MKKFILILFLINLLSGVVASADDDFLLGDNTGTSVGYFRFAHSEAGKTVVITWRRYLGGLNGDVQMIVLRYNNKGKIRYGKPATISTGTLCYDPAISFNPDTGKYLVTWVSYEGNYKTPVKGRLLNSNGKILGKELTIFADSGSSYEGLVTAPLTEEQFGPSKQGDFLIVAANYKFGVGGTFETVQFDSNDLSLTQPKKIGNRRIIGKDLVTMDNGLITIFGYTADMTKNEICIFSFNLAGNKQKYLKVADFVDTYVDNTMQLHQTSKKYLIAAWPLETGGSTQSPKSRLIKSRIKAGGPEMEIFPDDRGRVQQFVQDETGRNLVLFVSTWYRDIKVFEISEKGVPGDEIYNYRPSELYPYEGKIIRIPKNNQWLILYLTDSQLRGHVFQMEN